jgi:hypothetical protein
MTMILICILLTCVNGQAKKLQNRGQSHREPGRPAAPVGFLERSERC